MSRRYRTGGTIDVTVSMPKIVRDELDAYLTNPVTGRMPYGARSDFIVTLIKKTLKEAQDECS